jgi:hypothetical protein
MVHLIFEGAELSAKSFLISTIYPVLEKRDATSSDVLDGCYWINSDIGIFGTEKGSIIVEKYVEIAEILKEKNILFEKLHISDAIYQKQYRGVDTDYTFIEARLKEMGFKIVLTTFREDEDLIAKRLEERLKLYPHYGRIAKSVSFYIAQQELYRTAVKASSLPYLEVDMSDYDATNGEKVLEWAEK